MSGRGLGTNAIIREARVSKPSVWRYQKAYMEGGVERLLKEKGKGPKAGKTRISGSIRLEDNRVLRGYQLSHFQDAFERYLP